MMFYTLSRPHEIDWRMFEPLIFAPSTGARYALSKTVRKAKVNRSRISKRVRRKHRRAA